MVDGIDKFQGYFAGHEDKYAIIGGAACELIFEDVGLPFRATKDIDLVLCVEVVDTSFAGQLAAFIDDGGYEARQHQDGNKEFFRFHKPKDDKFPYMIELFSRLPGGLKLPETMEVQSLPVEDDIISLSAILLDEEYFAALQKAKREIDGITIVDEMIIIPFKARAFLDLSKRKAEGQEIRSKDIKKHRNDIIRLSQLLPQDARIEITGKIKADMEEFLDHLKGDETADPKALKSPMDRAEIVAFLRGAYAI